MLKKLLSQSSFWIINKDLASKLGFEPTLLLTHLIDCADMLNQPFYQQRDRILKDLGWTEHQYRKSVKVLKEYNLISVEVRGIPPKNYWSVNEGDIYTLFGSNTQDISVKSTHPYKRDIHAPKIRNKKNNNKQVLSNEGGVGSQNPPTTSSLLNHDEGGWEKLVRLYPKDKMNGEIDAITKWNILSQEDKQKVFRHLKVYIEKTEHQYIKQIGKYFQEEPWMKMKPKRNKYEGMQVIDGSKKSQETLDNENFIFNLLNKNN